MNCRVSVECLDLDVARRAVEGDRLAQAPVRLEPYGGSTCAGCAPLELGKEAPADPQPAQGSGDPHAFQVGGAASVPLQRGAADRLRAQRRDEEQARGRSELVSRDRQPGVEPGLEPAAELGEVLAQALLRIPVAGIDGLELDEPGGE
jgi:hypothetical protein